MRIQKGDEVVLKPISHIWRKANAEDRRKWEESEYSKGFGDDGESRLMSPTVLGKDLTIVYTVERARVCAPYGWGNRSGCVSLLDGEGTLWYTFRSNVMVLE